MAILNSCIEAKKPLQPALIRIVYQSGNHSVVDLARNHIIIHRHRRVIMLSINYFVGLLSPVSMIFRAACG